MIWGFPIAVLVMAGVATIATIGGGVVLALPARSEQAVYGKRIAATMILAFALILYLFAWGLMRAVA